jgi:hypothetical protein
MKILPKINGDQYEAFLTLTQKLEEFRIQIKNADLMYEKEKFFLLMDQLHHFFKKFKDKEVFHYFRHSNYLYKHWPFFNSVEHYYTRVSEAIEAVNLIKKRNQSSSKEITKDKESDLDKTKQKGNAIDEAENRFISQVEKNISKNTYLQTKEELKLLDLSDCKKLVMVGTGSLPETMLCISDQTQIPKIVGLDYNQEAVYLAGEIVRFFNKEKRIKLLHYNGMEFDYKDADVVYISSYVEHKNEIVSRIAETTKKNPQVIVRTPVLFGKLLYEQATQNFHPRFMKIKESKSNIYSLDKIIVLKMFDI